MKNRIYVPVFILFFFSFVRLSIHMFDSHQQFILIWCFGMEFVSPFFTFSTFFFVEKLWKLLLARWKIVEKKNSHFIYININLIIFHVFFFSLICSQLFCYTSLNLCTKILLLLKTEQSTSIRGIYFMSIIWKRTRELITHIWSLTKMKYRPSPPPSPPPHTIINNWLYTLHPLRNNETYPYRMINRKIFQWMRKNNFRWLMMMICGYLISINWFYFLYNALHWMRFQMHGKKALLLLKMEKYLISMCSIRKSFSITIIIISNERTAKWIGNEMKSIFIYFFPIEYFRISFESM